MRIITKLFAALLLCTCMSARPARAAALVANTGGTRSVLSHGKPFRLSHVARVVAASIAIGFASHAISADAGHTAQPSAEDVRETDAGKLGDLIRMAQDNIKTSSTQEARAEWERFLGSALMAKYNAKLGSSSDAKEGFHMMQAAFELEPHEPLFAVSYGRSLRGVSKLPHAIQPLAFGIFGLHINFEKEARKVSEALDDCADSALAQMIQSQLGTSLGDNAIVDRANAKLAGFSDEARDSAAKVLAGDDGRVAQSVKNGK